METTLLTAILSLHSNSDRFLLPLLPCLSGFFSMETNPEASPASSSGGKPEEHVVETSEGLFRSLFAIGHRRLFSTPSISLSDDDLKALKIEDNDSKDASPERRESSEEDQGSEPTSIASTSDSENHSSGSGTPHQWRGFFRKLKKGPQKALHTFHPSKPAMKMLSRKKSRNSRQSLPSIGDPTLDPDLYCLKSSWKNFSLSQLETATNNFSQENLIGQGGYSEVYKGNLESGQLVAIKRLTRGTPEEMTADFLSELGILVHANHPNIANVIGYGVEGGMHLVLHLSPHGSLASLLTGAKDKLEWHIRYKIAIGTAEGLAYLHEGCQRRIIHRDIKAANILLTEDFDAQISDFGLAKWLPEQWTHLTITQVEGTFGYLPPEFFLHGVVDEKTDVYAYGVLLLELISGRLALDKSQKSLVMWAKPLLAENNASELVDQSLSSACDADQLNCMVLTATSCLHESPSERPAMSKVVQMLKGQVGGGLEKANKKFQRRPGIKRTCSVGSRMGSFEAEDTTNTTKYLNDNKPMQLANC